MVDNFVRSDALDWAAVIGSSIGLTAFMTGRVPPLAAVGWIYTVVGVCLGVHLVAEGRHGMAAGTVGALGGVLALAVVLERLDARPRNIAIRRVLAAAGAEPGPPDCYGAAPDDDVPDGLAWVDHLTHTPGADEESPRLRVRRKTRGGPE